MRKLALAFPHVAIFGTMDFACILITYQNEVRIVYQSSWVDLLADLAMEFRNDAELAELAWRMTQ